MMRTLLLLPCFLAAIPAQVVVIPSLTTSAANVDRPWAGGIGRYQQWFSSQSLQAVLPEPRRIERIEFFAGTTPTALAVQINCEVLMSHGQASGLFATFANNYADAPVVVKPAGNVQLVAGPADTVVINIPLTTMFTWDGQRPLMLEIRILGNSNGNQPFLYNFHGAAAIPGTITRNYAAGSVGAASGTVTQGLGINVRFTTRPGVVLNYGTGCAGEGGFIPVAAVQQIPQPAITWTHQLTSAASQCLALWVVGDSNTAFGPLPLPADLTLLLGFGSSNCRLRTNALNIIATATVGGGAGGGLVSLPIPLPATTNYVGLNIYSQWVVLDPLALNGVLSVTAGIRSIVAPVGG